MRFKHALLSLAALFSGGRGATPPVEHEDKRNDFEVDPAHRPRGGKKSSSGRPSYLRRTPRYRAWGKLFGGLAVPPYVE